MSQCGPAPPHVSDNIPPSYKASLDSLRCHGVGNKMGNESWLQLQKQQAMKGQKGRGS